MLSKDVALSPLLASREVDDEEGETIIGRPDVLALKDVVAKGDGKFA